ncbi:hypothetical protein SAMN05216228_102357 [Rhizobium tibeticum]|uniref:Uncharacterized protein n=1 Tax=Rhizobium tibeticum TaxID=501024 RepID=A0A1H8S469_9HYPH|nr:hypothetical protein RTCCBAU85039_4566 [Rhizobium tibeticum]SEO73450.1 hypothetical protein SAMN05216228_102357 [Rhizobium tibeticum]
MLTHEYGRRFKREIASQPNAISTKVQAALSDNVIAVL